MNAMHKRELIELRKRLAAGLASIQDKRRLKTLEEVYGSTTLVTL